jgi:hypothetical protein
MQQKFKLMITLPMGNGQQTRLKVQMVKNLPGLLKITSKLKLKKIASTDRKQKTLLILRIR